MAVTFWLGVVAMFGSLLILLVLPITDISRIRGNQFRPLMKLGYWFFVVDFFILLWICAMHPETPYLEIGQVATAFYFIWFLTIVPVIGLIENTLMDLAINVKNTHYVDTNPHSKEKNLMQSKIKKKSVFKRLLIGFKKGYETPTLPKNLLKLENRLSVILMKFIGSMSLLLIYMNDYFHFHLLQTHY